MVTKKAKDAVAKALELDETLAEAHAALGYLKFRIDWDWEEADKEFCARSSLNPVTLRLTNGMPCSLGFTGDLMNH